jgi:hypothetical protein
VRASSADRETYTELLNQAYEDGQLDYGELSDRLDHTLNAKTLGELTPVLAELNLSRLSVVQQSYNPPAGKTVATRPKAGMLTRTKVIITGAALALTLGLGIGIVNGINDFTDAPTGGGQGIEQRFGDSSVSYQNQADIPPSYHLGAGNLEIDLSDCVIIVDSEYAFSVTAGDLDITLPENANVIVNWNVVAGEYNGLNQHGGIRSSGTETFTRNSDYPTITLNLNVGAGEITVN